MFLYKQLGKNHLKNNRYFVQLHLKKNIIKSTKVTSEFLHKLVYNFDRPTNKLVDRTDFKGFLFDLIMNKILFICPHILMTIFFYPKVDPGLSGFWIYMC